MQEFINNRYLWYASACFQQLLMKKMHWNIIVGLGGGIFYLKSAARKRKNFCMLTLLISPFVLVQGSPVYMAETASCEYLFNWKTPAACPLKYFKGAHCQVYDENYDFNFDLTSLTKDYDLPIEKNLKYRGKICGEKSSSCSLQGEKFCGVLF